MATALERALADTGAGAVAGAVDRIAVPQGTWSYPDPARLVAAAIGAGHARTHLVELGIPQQTLFNDAMAAVLEGSSEVAVVVGGESMRWARDRDRAGLDPAWTVQTAAVPDVQHRRDGPLLEPVEVAHRFWEPVQQYAMIENALRAADGQTPDQQRSAVSALWARFNRVATVNPGAAFPAPRDAVFLATPSPENRPLSFPYNKWHSSQSTVNQAAAMVDGVYHSIYEALKPGGFFAIVDHSAPPGTGDAYAKSRDGQHRIDEELVKGKLAKGGFKLEAESNLLRNPDDDRSKPFFAPEMKGKNTDKFALLFRKPE